jgi:hypothetical protein
MGRSHVSRHCKQSHTEEVAHTRIHASQDPIAGITKDLVLFTFDALLKEG